MCSKGIHSKVIDASYTDFTDSIRGFIAKEKRLQKHLECYDTNGSTENIESGL